MSANDHSFPCVDYQINTISNDSDDPHDMYPYSFKTIQIGQFPKKSQPNIYMNRKDYDNSLFNSVNLTYEYIYVDEPPDLNTIFFDSNLRKYRIRSASKKKIEYRGIAKPINNSYSQQTNKSLNNTFNKTNLTYDRKEGNSSYGTIDNYRGKKQYEKYKNINIGLNFIPNRLNKERQFETI